MTYEPAIKWSGSKRSQAEEILKYFPRKIHTYHEPFCGGASMLAALLNSNIECKEYIASDLNNDLISLWNLIKENPIEIYRHYETLWNELNKDNDCERKKEYFYSVRERFNREKDPKDFMFIMRTTTNGMPRYNSNGDFNNSFHVTRNGIVPITLRDILLDWSKTLNEKNVQFVCQSYDKVETREDDIVYLDPPYANTKGMYYGAIDNKRLWEFLRRIKCGWLMSFDGISGDIDNTYNVPNDIYDEHIYLKSGNSSFKRTIGRNSDAMVYESLYIKGCNKIENKGLF